MTKILTLEECRALYRAIGTRGSKRTQATDRALLTALILCGKDARTWAWSDVTESLFWMPLATFQAIKDMAIVKQLTIFPFNHAGFHAAHWIGGTRLDHAVFSVGSKPLTTQEVTRRMKRYARLAGISCERVSLRTLCNTAQVLLDLYGDGDALADALGWAAVETNIPAPTMRFAMPAGLFRRDPRLHGVGRRTSRSA